MGLLYEARAVTNCGSYRAFALVGRTIAISEDGVDGIIDYFQLAEDGPAADAPELLVQVLIEWIYEFRRAEQLLEAVLSRRS